MKEFLMNPLTVIAFTVLWCTIFTLLCEVERRRYAARREDSEALIERLHCAWCLVPEEIQEKVRAELVPCPTKNCPRFALPGRDRCARHAKETASL